MIPFGVRGGTKAQNEAAEAMELAILGEPETRPIRTERNNAPEEPAAPVPRPAAPSVSEEPAADASSRFRASFTLVTRPVRSGQRVYAAGGDLSIIAAVSSGAELMADGNIHVYGPLRGRALAGMKGNTDARIFCQDLQAELVSVAGHYRVSENIPTRAARRSRPDLSGPEDSQDRKTLTRRRVGRRTIPFWRRLLWRELL